MEKSVSLPLVSLPLVTLPLVTLPLVTLPLVTLPLVTLPLVTLPLMTGDVVNPLEPLDKRIHRDIVQGCAADYDQVIYHGSGRYGTVFRVHRIDFPFAWCILKVVRVTDKKANAQKKLDERRIPIAVSRSAAQAESRLWSQLDHVAFPVIHRVRMFTVEKREYFVIEMEEMENGNLHNYLHAHPPRIPVFRVQSWIRQLVLGLEYIHDRKIIHRDLKPLNLLLHDDGNVMKIGDWGMAKAMAPDDWGTSSPQRVTLGYRAPEILRGQEYGTSIDIWSLGCCLYEMVMKRPLFEQKTELSSLAEIEQMLTGTIPYRELSGDGGHYRRHPSLIAFDLVCREYGHVGTDLLHLFECLLQIAPERRLTARQILQHPFLSTSIPAPDSILTTALSVTDHTMTDHRTNHVIERKMTDHKMTEHKKTDARDPIPVVQTQLSGWKSSPDWRLPSNLSNVWGDIPDTSLGLGDEFQRDVVMTSIDLDTTQFGDVDMGDPDMPSFEIGSHFCNRLGRHVSIISNPFSNSPTRVK